MTPVDELENTLWFDWALKRGPYVDCVCAPAWERRWVDREQGIEVIHQAPCTLTY